MIRIFLFALALPVSSFAQHKPEVATSPFGKPFRSVEQKPAAPVLPTASDTPAPAEKAQQPVQKAATGVSASENRSPAWEIRREDRFLRVALERWAAAASYQFEWAPTLGDYVVSLDTRYVGSFQQALIQAMAGTTASDRPLRVCDYATQSPPAVRVIRRTDSCMHPKE